MKRKASRTPSREKLPRPVRGAWVETERGIDTLQVGERRAPYGARGLKRIP